MRVLIIEDNSFNAFCLRRLLESNIALVSVTIVNNSRDALSVASIDLPDLVIIDGELCVTYESVSHGPQLAAILLQKYPHLPIVAWSDSEYMRGAFAKVFVQNHRLVNEYNTWAKAVSLECIHKTWAYYFGNSVGEKQQVFSLPRSLVRGRVSATYQLPERGIL